MKIAEQKRVPLNALTLADVQGVQAAFGADWVNVFDLKRALAARTGTGMPGPKQIAKQFARWQKVLAS